MAKQRKVSAPDDREPKWKACKRLEAEGRITAFRQRQAFFRSSAGGSLSRDDAFYRALAEFPPNGMDF